MSGTKRKIRQERGLREAVAGIVPAPGFEAAAKQSGRRFKTASLRREKVLRSQGNRKPKGQR